MMPLEREARCIGFKYVIFGLLLAAAVPLILIDPKVIWYWYVPWWRQLAIGVIGVAAIVWIGAPWAFCSAATNRKSLAPVLLAVLALAGGGFAGSAASLVVYDEDLNMSNFLNYLLGPVFWLLLVGVPFCLILGFLYRRSIASSIAGFSPQQ